LTLLSSAKSQNLRGRLEWTLYLQLFSKKAKIDSYGNLWLLELAKEVGICSEFSLI
jgi:hypothetical protein